MDSYLIRTPGLTCQHCSKDISDRTKGTKYCFDCQKIVARKNAAKRKEKIKLLEARDTVLPLVPWEPGDTYLKCQICGHTDQMKTDMFCYHCGQRLKEENNV